MGMFTILNPFHIDGIHRREDRVTFAFACVMHEAGLPGLLDMLQTLDPGLSHWNTGSWDKGTSKFSTQYQVQGPNSKPDAGFEFANQLHVLFENKSPNNILKKKQIENHLLVFKRRTEHKVMLGVTHYLNPPAWWHELKERRPDVRFVYGNWNQIRNWASVYGQKAGATAVTSYLLEKFRQYVPRITAQPPAWLRPFFDVMRKAGQKGIAFSELDFAMLRIGFGLPGILSQLEYHLEDSGGLYNVFLRSKRVDNEWVFTLHEVFLREERAYEHLIRLANLD